jgi:WD40 repeat protein
MEEGGEGGLEALTRFHRRRRDVRNSFCVLLLLLSLTLSPSRAAAPPSPAVDAYGDPLPDGAAARLGTLRWRTGDFVNGLTWSPDGRWIASAENGGVARLWDAAMPRH